MFNKQWIYSKLGNTCLAVLVETEEQQEKLKAVFNDKREGTYKEIPIAKALKMINKAKENVEKENELRKEEKPRRKRRTKAEIEAEKELEENNKENNI